MESLEGRVQKIEERNKIVELDKAWETSWARRILIVTFTYAVVGVFLHIINIQKPWTSAIVPALAFTLSTLTMPFLKSAWMKHFRK